VIFFATQLLFGIWAASGLWLAMFISYIVRRSKVLIARSRMGQALIPLPPLPVLPAPEPLPAFPPVAQDAERVSHTQTENSVLRGTCEHCQQHLEFDPKMTGQSISCPRCKAQTKLVHNLALPSSHPKTDAKCLPVGIPIRRHTQPTSNTQPSEQTLEMALKQIARLKEQKLITESDYEEKKRKLLGL
jgi:hypothetical protein